MSPDNPAATSHNSWFVSISPVVFDNVILPSTDALPAAPHPDWLRTFEVFAEHLNFVKSAELLQLSQPAVHAQVAKLAAHYGEALYRREGRILRLTDVGRRVSAFAREILERSARFEAELTDRTAGRPATLAAGEGVWLHLLAAPVGRGDLRVRPVVMRGPEIRESVSRGDVDIGVVVGAPAGPGMDSMLLRESDRVLAVRSECRRALR